MLVRVIPLTVVELGEDALLAAQEVLRSGMLVQGERVAAFEAQLARRTGRQHAVAVASGTAALSLSMQALGVAAGDEVLCPALTWPSPAHAAKERGATPVLVDVDPAQWNVRPEALSEARSERTRLAVVIDQFGNPAAHDAIGDALGDLPVLVDAACALGSAYQDEPCGRHGTIACLSFHPRKIVTTGEGGACLTDDEALAEQLRALRNHGQRAPGQFVCAAGNHRMTDLAAALGLAQLERLDAQIDARRRLAQLYRDRLPELSFQQALPGARENAQTLGVLIGEPGDAADRRDRVIAQLRARGVGAGPLSYALHTLPQLADEARAAETAGRSLQVAADVAARGLALPLYPSMLPEQVDQVSDALRAVLASS